ncbi:MAG: RagB/SusD family nutrient uptake outer membrane protein [Paludibacter sp.]|nr:RagB/SusD family nutrient uptake outer membrane protein [Bacteroidales bacterium]MCM1069687.1 RagB/SusD family nutrient uptake outer membrane protein [Prevotella sp.]MCM1354405.1 RagB/SusD family nutrient uptake outer membrane protein [Bacteroides sp.]MCM1441952.1 RagB/SusD family nutrient uptake outer membrane protein [Muribaculum sp.]MCM1482626.1 RagB/SusD family nutrient uptake outer membrane protein [Paludibacter sp.]
MKTYNKLFLLGCLAMFGLTACVNDLNVEPKDPNTVMVFDQDAVFTKIYATLAITGQKGPDGDGDVDGIDEGTSSFYRMMWELNEFPTDEGWWIWNDVGLGDIRIMNWSSTNTLVAGLYYRLYFDITLCNHFLDNTKDLSDTKTQQQRAEVRFIRALNYWYLLDMFGSVPFVDNVSLATPRQKTRSELCTWLEQELLVLADELPQDGQRISKYRVDQVAAWMLLARIYLNAEIYTGTPQWDKAAEYAAKVMNSSYKLHTQSSSAYTAYQELFMGDNDTNGAMEEAVLMIYQDGNYTESWGNARFLVNAFRDTDMQPSGSSDTWSCFRSSQELVAMFVDADKAADIKADEFQMPAAVGDDRAILCSYYECPLKTDDGRDSVVVKTWELSGTMASDFYASWAICKWTGRYASDVTGTDPDWPDTDIPMLRVAEAYLTYAEAVYRGGSAVNGTAEDAVKALRDRANNTTAFTLSADFLLDEWAREFYAEGRRRTDLVRFHEFAGESATRNWEGRGNVKSGSATKKMDKKYNLYPIPEAEIVANGTLRQTWED